ncbi:MAG TPA: response regulator, partial [Kiloniellales bacterium]|nr:response regulator [Kiloniellales bacterium]
MSAVRLSAEREIAIEALDLVDGAPDPLVEALAEAARRMTGYVAAAVVLIDSRRQWVRACVGDSESWRDLARGSRLLPFCSETLAQDECLLVPDARADLRSAAHPMVAGRPFIRAFAGVPLRIGGVPVGVLCCLDHEARRPSSTELAALVSLGCAVEQAFAQRQERLALAQNKARQSQRFARILESMPDALLVLDAQGHLAGSNNALFELAGVTRWSIGHPREAGRYLLQRLAEVRAFGEERAEQIVKRIESRQRFHTRQCLSNGRWIDVTIEPISGGGAILFCRDVDEDVRQLELARDQAIAADRAKSNFLATMSHEIRSPLNGVVGMLDLLSETRLDEEQRHFIEVAGRSSDHLLSVINDILDFAKLEAGRLDLEAVDFELVDLVERTIELVSAPAQEKGLELVTDFAEGLPISLRGDPTRLSQILLNLVSNAVKFSDKGEVLVSVAPGATRGSLRLSVVDQGVGMTQEMLQRLFRPFSQAESSINRRYGGTGLGLAICHDLVKLMGGRIGAKSAIGKGSSFWFEIPLASAQVVSALPARLPALAGKRCLVVDDCNSSARRLSQQLQGLGLDCDRVAEAEAACRSIERARVQGRPYALICIDEVMPAMRGVDLAARLYELAGMKETRLVLCTGSGVPLSEGERSLFDSLIAKPIRTRRLAEALERLFDPAAVGAIASTRVRQGPVPPSAPPMSEFQVLLVEDNAVNREIATRVLRRVGIPATIAEGGLAAIDIASRQRFSLVLMDIEMPDLDGLQTMTRLRALAGWDRDTPIVALTAHALADTRQKLLAAGFDDYLAKPFHGRA